MDSLRLVASLQSSSTDDALQTGHQQRTPSVLGSIDLYSELSEALKKKWDEHDEPVRLAVIFAGHGGLTAVGVGQHRSACLGSRQRRATVA